MTPSLYVPSDTWIHRLHPVVKLVAMLGLFTAVFLTDRPALLAPLLIGAVATAAGARALVSLWRVRLLCALVFLMTFVVWSLFYRGGEPLAAWGPFSVSAEGLHFAFGMGLKLVAFLGLGVLFLATTKVEEFAYALTRLGMPFKVGFTMTLAFRLVPVFLDATITVVQAQRCRGFNFDEGNIVQRIRRYVPVIVPVFIGALRRADGMAMALEARGFQSPHPRSALEEYSFSRLDAVGMTVVGAVAALYIVLWRSGYATFVAA